MKLAIAFAWIAFWVGAAYMSIGIPSKCAPATWDIVPAVFFMMAIPSYLSYRFGLDVAAVTSKARKGDEA